MANVLGELFGDIANSIRNGLGDIGKMKPNAFPEKIDEIVAQMGDSTEEVNDILDEINGEVVGESIYTVTFASKDGLEIYGTIQVVENDDCPDPVATNVFAEPYLENTAEHENSFIGWSKTPGGTRDPGALTKITEDVTLYAAFYSKVRSYTIVFYDGTTVLSRQTLKYGATPSIADPEKQYHLFEGWEPEIATVTGNAAYYAKWIERPFSVASWARIAEICEEGKAKDYFTLGEEKEILCNNGETIVARIAGFDHDELFGTIDEKASLSIVLSTVVNAQYTYSESSTTYVNWKDSALRTAIAALEDMLPADLRTVIADVWKPYKGGIRGEQIYSSQERLWPLSPTEAGFSGTSDGSKVYELYKSGTGAALTKYNEETNVPYWLREPSSAGYWYMVDEDGRCSFEITGESAYLHFGFCIK